MLTSIDCRYIRERPSGISHYTQSLVDRIPRLTTADRFHFWVNPLARRPLSTSPNVLETVIPAPANGLRTLLWPARLVDLTEVDVFHAPFNILGRKIPCASVVTIHDLMWLFSPTACEGQNLTTPLLAAFYCNGIRRALRKATRLIAISTATADTIAQVVPHRRRVIRVIPHGLEPHFRPPVDREQAQQAAQKTLGIGGPYLLVVGQNTPSKNHAAIVEAFAAAELNRELRLVLLQRLYQNGRWGLGRRPQLYDRAHALGIADRVHWLSLVSDAELVLLMQGALALVQFSTYEGHGMPALEALACGTPVIASFIAPLLEVLGDAALYVPLTTEKLAAALRTIVREPSLRRELSEKGVQRSKGYSWDRCARLHLEVYREAAQDS